jgi:purine-binding chemotaxis protein CheW
MEETNTKNSYLSFKLGKETFASNVSNVLSILEMPVITEVPQTPDYMIGVMNLRDEVLPVIDMRVKFGMEATTITSSTCVLVLQLEIEEKTFKIGALVDSVEEVVELEEDIIKPCPTIGTKYNDEFIMGMAQKGDGFSMILNMKKVFATQNILELVDANQEPIYK